jgi:hypothetical protein
MAWFDNLLNHFALYPAHLFALLFVMALSKSTVLISSVLPPASVMLLAGITVSQSEHASGAGVACRGDGGNGGFGAELPYRPADGAHAAGRALHGKHADTFLRAAPAAKERCAGAVYARFLAVLRYVVPLAAGCSG